jgi:hypothetical protein
LQDLVQEKVDWYLDELVGELELQTGKLVSISTLWCSLVYCGISRKKVNFFEIIINNIGLLYLLNVFLLVTSSSS